MANQDPRIEAFKDSVYIQAHNARLLREGHAPIDNWQDNIAATHELIIAQREAQRVAQLQAEGKRQSQDPYSLTAYIERTGWRQPPGSPALQAAKERAINGGKA